MNRTIAPPTLVIVFAAAFALGIMPRAEAGEHRGCSNASLQGSFGFTGTGTLLTLPAPLAGPYAEVGRQIFDGYGNTDATETVSTNGTTHNLTIQGTYAVNPDCTGSMTVLIIENGHTQHADFVIDDDGAELRYIVTDAGFIQTRVYKKQFSRGRQD